jgi:hypothetical protein
VHFVSIRVNAVGKMTVLLAGRFGVRAPVTTSNCFPLLIDWKDSGTYSLLCNGYRVRPPRVQRPGRAVRAIIPLLYAFMAETGTRQGQGHDRDRDTTGTRTRQGHGHDRNKDTTGTGTRQGRGHDRDGDTTGTVIRQGQGHEQ